MIHNLPTSLIEASRQTLENSLYESILLLEDRIDFLKSKNPTIDTSHDHLAVHKNSSDIIDHFANADPTTNKIYTPWILNQYKKKNIRQEDTGKIYNTLSNFDKYKKKLDKKDANQYKSLSDIQSAVQPHIGTAATKTEEKQEIRSKGRTLIHDDGNGLKVYRLEPTEEGKKASQDIYGGGAAIGGTHTEWCTADRRDDFNIFNDYNEHGLLYTIHTPTDNVYQAHVENDQLMDKHDNSVNGKHPDAGYISRALSHIPDGFKLKLTKKLQGVITVDELNKASNDDDESIRAAVAGNSSATKEHLDKALTDKYSHVRAAAAGNLNATKEHLDKALEDHIQTVRTAAAGNPSATKEHLDKALGDGYYQIREVAAKNPSVTKEQLNRALKDIYSHVRTAAAGNPSATKEHLDKALEDEYPDVRAAAAGNLNATKEHLDKALGDGYSVVRIAATKNPNATKEHLDKALSDKNSYIRNIAIKHPNITKENLDKAINDNDLYVRATVIDHPQM